MASKRRRADQFTVLARNVPHGSSHSVSDNVDGFFKKNHLGHNLCHQVVYNENKFGRLVGRRYRLQNWFRTHRVSSCSRANLSDDAITLTLGTYNTNLTENTGRATYIRSLHLYDNKSRGLARFSTSFTFVLDSNQSTSYSDGLTFFLAQDNSVLTFGRAMRLLLNDALEPAASRFVAVEFDTFWNNWNLVIGRDTPMGDHVV
ncbi:L-type lectin-domain containing receptor kinase IX.1-like protein [Tanacetum coccineum]